MGVNRIKTVEYDPQAGGWIARDPNTGEVIGGDDWRWNCRASARDVVIHAKHRAERAAGAGVDTSRGGQPK